MKHALTLTAATFFLFASMGTADAKLVTRVKVAWTKYKVKSRTASLKKHLDYIAQGITPASTININKIATQLNETAGTLFSLSRKSESRAAVKKSGLMEASRAYLAVNKQFFKSTEKAVQTTSPFVLFTETWGDYSGALHALAKQVK
ncbi:MAG: hypothetical protein JRH20_17855 [Deltaproteobacteria bacterium]|nr:hypothetical protein [Deltaproteobacteria bacterium]